MRPGLGWRGAALAAVLAAAVVACRGSGGGDSGPRFTCASSPPEADTVVLRCAGAPEESRWRIAAEIGVPTTATDIATFNFDVVFDPALVTFVDGSAVAGNVLDQNGGTVWPLAGTQMGDVGRVVVGIHVTDSSGVQAIAGRSVIISFEMQADLANPFDPSLVRFERAEARDVDDRVIESITFSDRLLLSVR